MNNILSIKYFKVMKQFFGKLVAFMVVVLILSVALDYVITKGLSKYFEYETEAMIDLRDSNVNPDFIILGSCQAVCSYAPEVFDSVINTNSYVFGAYNMTLPTHLCIWDVYKKYHTRLPQYVLMTVDYSDLHYAPLKKTIIEKQFVPLVYDKPVRDYMLSDGGYNAFEVYCPLYRYFGYHQLIKNGVMGFLDLRHGARHRYKGQERMSVGYEFARADVPDDNYIVVESELIERLSAWIKEVQGSGVKPILVTAPLGYELAEKILNAEDAYRVYDSLANQYHIPYLRYQDHPICRDTAMFNTPAHLNYIGAAKFSKMVADTLLTIQY